MHEKLAGPTFAEVTFPKIVMPSAITVFEGDGEGVKMSIEQFKEKRGAVLHGEPVICQMMGGVLIMPHGNDEPHHSCNLSGMMMTISTSTIGDTVAVALQVTTAHPNRDDFDDIEEDGNGAALVPMSSLGGGVMALTIDDFSALIDRMIAVRDLAKLEAKAHG